MIVSDLVIANLYPLTHHDVPVRHASLRVYREGSGAEPTLYPAGAVNYSQWPGLEITRIPAV